MQIPKKTWDKYIKQLSSLNYAAGTLIKDYVETNGIEDKKALTDYAYYVVQKYGNGSAALSAAMYDTLAALEGANVAPAVMADLPEYDEVAKTVYGTLKSSKNPDELASATSRLVKRAGADTTLKNAKRDGAQFAWVPAGDTCAFCLALASNGWQYMSKEAMKGGHAEHIHANCDCTYAVRFDKSTTVAGYDPQKYKDIYDDAEGKSSKDKVNAIRRMQYNENKDKINAQKREAYALRKDREFAEKINLAAQNTKDSKIPSYLVGDYSDYSPLTVTSDERKALQALHEKALETDNEYGQIIYNGGQTEILTDNLHDRVHLPVSEVDSDGLKVYHSHTNDTPPSSQDFAPLTLEKVDQIGVPTRNGDLWIVRVGDGYRPTLDELTDYIDTISDEVNADIIMLPEFKDLTIEEKNYVAAREQFFRTCREFGWLAEGGALYEE